MLTMPKFDLAAVIAELDATQRRVKVLWQQGECLGFVARGREYRSEFHINACDEVQVMLKGTMQLHYLAPDGDEQVLVLPEGATNYISAGVPHSPRFPPDAYVLVLERMRRAEDIDRFQWFCPACRAFLHEETAHVDDYRNDPVGRAYRRFFEDEAARTCGRCGHVMPTN
jgi:3-hydroxyanthranilate 3,4-dioxygenase